MGNVMFMRKGEVHTAPVSPFPPEPAFYTELVGTYTTSQTWTTPEDGWFQIELFGASGSGAACKYATYSTSAKSYYATGATGGGGGGGAYAMSQIPLKKGDTITLASISVGGTATVTVVSTHDESYSHTMKCVSGKNGSAGSAWAKNVTNYGATGGAGGTGGTASGGLNTNTNGNAGGTGGTLTASYETNSSGTKYTSGGAGGSAAVSGCRTGGAGGKAKIVYSGRYPSASSYTSAGSGSAAYMKIYRGDTNLA